MKDVFNEFRDRFSLFFESLGNRFSDFVSLENKLENTPIFSDITKSEPGIWGRRSTTDLSPLKTKA